jgi:hypothetical protein
VQGGRHWSPRGASQRSLLGRPSAPPSALARIDFRLRLIPFPRAPLQSYLAAPLRGAPCAAHACSRCTDPGPGMARALRKESESKARRAKGRPGSGPALGPAWAQGSGPGTARALREESKARAVSREEPPRSRLPVTRRQSRSRRVDARPQGYAFAVSSNACKPACASHTLHTVVTSP